MGVWIVVLVVVLVALIAAVGWLYSSLMQLERRCTTAWAQVEAQLQERHALTDNLLTASRQCVSADTAFEAEEVEKAVAWARSATSTEERVKAENALTNAVTALSAHKANCADLIHSTALMSAKRKITAADAHMRYARQSYNDAVAAYDEARGRFPYNVVATVFGKSFPVLDAMAAKPPVHPNAKIKGASGEKPAK